MEFKQLESFVAVVRHNSFTKAAEVLYTSQPTVSNHIRQLEEELNAPLINRTTKAVEVTPRGWEAYEMACSILEQRNRLLSRWAGRTQYAIHLGTTAIPSAYILPEVLTAYREAHADTEFVIQQNDAHRVLEGLLDGTFDLGLLEYPISEERLSCIPFFQDHTVMITPATDRFRARRCRSLTSVQISGLIRKAFCTCSSRRAHGTTMGGWECGRSPARIPMPHGRNGRSRAGFQTARR